MALFKVEICGVNTSKLPLLTEEEKKVMLTGVQKLGAFFQKGTVCGN